MPEPDPIAELLAQVAEEHAYRGVDPTCSCGWNWDCRAVVLPSQVNFDRDRYHPPSEVRAAQHRAHLAEAQAAALRASRHVSKERR